MIYSSALALVLVELFLLLLALRGMRLLLSLSPLSPGRRAAVDQAMPVIELAVGLVFAVAAIQRLFIRHPSIGAAGTLGVLVCGLWLSRLALTNFVSGVLTRASGTVSLGDRIQLDGVAGRVTQMGSRALTLQTRGGDEAVIPYSRLSTESVVRTSASSGGCRHTFVVARPAALSTGAGSRHVAQLAMLCHWSSAARPPRVEITQSGDLEVTVFALEAERGPDIEGFVRQALVT